MALFIFILWATIAALISILLGPAAGIIGASILLVTLFALERIGAGLFGLSRALGRGLRALLGRAIAGLRRRAR